MQCKRRQGDVGRRTPLVRLLCDATYKPQLTERPHVTNNNVHIVALHRETQRLAQPGGVLNRGVCMDCLQRS